MKEGFCKVNVRISSVVKRCCLELVEGLLCGWCHPEPVEGLQRGR
jgi:hypothetical protein